MHVHGALGESARAGERHGERTGASGHGLGRGSCHSHGVLSVTVIVSPGEELDGSDTVRPKLPTLAWLMNGGRFGMFGAAGATRIGRDRRRHCGCAGQRDSGGDGDDLIGERGRVRPGLLDGRGARGGAADRAERGAVRCCSRRCSRLTPVEGEGPHDRSTAPPAAAVAVTAPGGSGDWLPVDRHGLRGEVRAGNRDLQPGVDHAGVQRIGDERDRLGPVRRHEHGAIRRCAKVALTPSVWFPTTATCMRRGFAEVLPTLTELRRLCRGPARQ